MEESVRIVGPWSAFARLHKQIPLRIRDLSDAQNPSSFLIRVSMFSRLAIETMLDCVVKSQAMERAAVKDGDVLHHGVKSMKNPASDENSTQSLVDPRPGNDANNNLKAGARKYPIAIDASAFQHHHLMCSEAVETPTTQTS
jgi:hypothetical protein